MLSVIQRILFVIGASCTSAACGAGIVFLLALPIFPLNGQAWASVSILTVLALIGSVIGALVGIACSINWIARQPGDPWTLGTWIGVFVGLAIGQAIRVFDTFEGFILGYVIEWLPGTIVFFPFIAFLGGAIGAFTTAWIKRIHPNPFANRKQ